MNSKGANTKKYYLAYGSNLNIYQMAYRCPEAKEYGTAKIKGYELLFKGSKTGAYLTIEKNKGSYVPVAVWETSESDERSLDRYEGYPSFYYKKEITLPVTTFEGETKNIAAYVYIMHECRKPGIPSKSYINTCVDGYIDFGFPIAILKKAIERTHQKILEEKRSTI